jgi:hypothetical protein
VNYWDGASWHWANQGLPGGLNQVAPSTAITYVDSNGNRRIYVFAGGGGHLVVNYWDGFNWQWADQSAPYGIVGQSAITYVDAAGNRRIYCFARGGDHLVVNYWDGFNWNWADQGIPAGASQVDNPSAITYIDSAGQRRIYVFANDGIGGHLFVNYWDGFSWHWADQGK